MKGRKKGFKMSQESIEQMKRNLRANMAPHMKRLGTKDSEETKKKKSDAHTYYNRWIRHPEGLEDDITWNASWNTNRTNIWE